MLYLEPFSTASLVALAFCFVLVFEFANGFHDTANAAAAVNLANQARPGWGCLNIWPVAETIF